MREPGLENWENRIWVVASELAYPPTPDISGRVKRRLETTLLPRTIYPHNVVWAAVFLVILLLATILLVPPVRAAVLDFLQIGAVRIFLVEPTATATPTPAPSSPTPFPEGGILAPTATSSPTPVYLASILDLQGETTLEQALDQVPFAPSLPTYPVDLGDPDRVFLQDQNGQVLFLVWTAPQHPETVRLSLHVIPPGSWAVTKIEPVVINQTEVNGQTAYWAEGPYMVVLTSGNIDIRRLVDGHVLIWEHDGLTYRLESDLPMDEAVKIAESLTPISR